MKILHKFDEDEGRLLFWVDGIVGGPVIYADTVEEGSGKVILPDVCVVSVLPPSF